MSPLTYHPFRSAEAKEKYLAYYDAAVKEWPIPFQEKTIETSFGQTFVRVSGPVDAPPLVLLPGAGSCSLMWRLNVADLSQSHRTYAVDSLINLGCVGRSVYTHAITGADDAMAWLDELFNGLKLGSQINLLGPSYGGWLASQYALHAPNRLNKIVLLAPAGTVLPFRLGYILRTILLNLVPHPAIYHRFFKWSLPNLAQKNNQLLEAIANEFLFSSQCFEAMNPRELPTLTALSDEKLHTLNVSALVLVGKNEVLYSAEKVMQRLQELAPQICAEIIPDAGHDLLLVQSDLVNQKIVSFLTEQDA